MLSRAEARSAVLTVALQLGHEALDRGWTADLTKEKVTTVLPRSAEYGALNTFEDLSEFDERFGG
jgi:hypothetical protein